MKSLRCTLGVVTGFCLVCLVSPGLRAQNQNPSSTAGTTAELTQRLEDLQKQIDRPQAELASARLQLKGFSEPAGAAASVPVPGAAEAAASPVVSKAESAPPASSPGLMKTLLGSTSLSGFVDGYYGYNFEHPRVNAPSVLLGNPGTGLSGLRAFDSPYNQFSLNAVELILDKPPDANTNRIGYHVAVGFGNAMNVVGSTEPGGLGYAQYLKEAYGSYLAPVGKGLHIDFGKFVTQHGAEVIESKDNWNYSRGILFTYAIPFYHFGLRTKYVFNDKYQFSAYLVNGWNNIVDNNTGKTVGLQFGWNPNKKIAVIQNYMVGPEEASNNSTVRQLWDTVVTYSPTGKLSFILNYDYGRGDRMAVLANPVWWTGGAGYVRYQFSNNYALATRYEYYNDHFGFTTGTGQHINEFTGTFERKIHGSFITRLEYRRDIASRPSLYKGTTPVNYQDTLAAGLIYTFDTREAQ